MKPVSILVDNAIRSYASVAQTVTVPVPGFGNRLLLIQAGPARSAIERWLQSQIEALPTIARLAREGLLVLNTYTELEFEFDRGARFPANVFGDVFKNVPISRIDAPVERSFFFQEEMKAYIQKDAQTRFCQWLLSQNVLPKENASIGQAGAEQVANFQQLDRYREICRLLHPPHFIDAYHLWTVEVNGVGYFLTTDCKFVRALANNRKLQLICGPIFPTDLLDRLKVTTRDPLPFQWGRRYTLNGLPYDK